MTVLPVLDEARRAGEAATREGVELVRTALREQVRRSMGLRTAPGPACQDPDLAYFPPGSVARAVNGDFSSMLVGGLAALLLQMLHPLAMAGVDHHSSYRTDPLGRLERTAGFLGTTTFGTVDEAAAAVARVRRIHAAVSGVAADGRNYRADDPALLTWVHAAETRSFLSASLAYGTAPLPPTAQDAYLDQMARVALDLGAVEVARSVPELDAYFARVRPDLHLTAEARQARNFIVRGVGRWPHELAAYGVLLGAAVGVLPGWARRQLRLPSLPAGDHLAVRPAARALTSALRWVTELPAGEAASGERARRTGVETATG